MNITDRLGDAMLRAKQVCNRCGYPAHGWVDVFHKSGDSHYRLCDACLTDFGIFMSTPPEIPRTDISSDRLAETEGAPNGPHQSP